MQIAVKIRQKPDRKYLLLYYIDPVTGNEVSRSSGTADRGQAERMAATWEAELAQTRGTENDGWAHFRLRFDDEKLSILCEKSRKNYTTALNHFGRITKVVRLSEITASMISMYQGALVKEERPATSIANYLTHLRAALKFAELIGMMVKAPKIQMPHISERKFMRGRPITEIEYKLILKACPSLAWHRLLELLWLSGLRLGEAMRLSWDRPPVRVLLDAKPYPQLQFYAEGHKSRQDDVIPMTPELAAWLEKTPKNQRVGLVAPVPITTPERASEFISQIGRDAGVVVNDDGKAASAHDLRRAFGTRWAAVVRPLTLQRLMRHSHIETTLKYYVGLTAADAGAEIWGVRGVPTNVPKPGRRPGIAG